MTKKFDPFSLITGILSLILAFVILDNPIDAFSTFITIVGVFSVIEGILKWTGIRFAHWLVPVNTRWGTISAILDIILGLVIIYVPQFGAAYIWISLAMWFIFDSIFELWVGRFVRSSEKGYYGFHTILAVIGLIVGIILLFSPAFAMSLSVAIVAMYLTLFGIVQVVRSF